MVRATLLLTYKLARRIVITVIGTTVVLIGVAMIVLPGPAVIVISLGFGILAGSVGCHGNLIPLADLGLWLWPEIMHEEAPFVSAVVISYTLPALIGMLKFGVLTTYHTWSVKAAVAFMGSTSVLMFAGG